VNYVNNIETSGQGLAMS